MFVLWIEMRKFACTKVLSPKKFTWPVNEYMYVVQSINNLLGLPSLRRGECSVEVKRVSIGKTKKRTWIMKFS